jgi:PAS domain-containing protein
MPKFIMGLAEDITKRKHAEKALRESEQRNRTLLEINNAIITNLTREALFQSVSEALQRVITFDRSALTLYDPQRDALRFVAFTGNPFALPLAMSSSAARAAWVGYSIIDVPW